MTNAPSAPDTSETLNPESYSHIRAYCERNSSRKDEVYALLQQVGEKGYAQVEEAFRIAECMNVQVSFGASEFDRVTTGLHDAVRNSLRTILGDDVESPQFRVSRDAALRQLDPDLAARMQTALEQVSPAQRSSLVPMLQAMTKEAYTVAQQLLDDVGLDQTAKKALMDVLEDVMRKAAQPSEQKKQDEDTADADKVVLDKRPKKTWGRRIKVGVGFAFGVVTVWGVALLSLAKFDGNSGNDDARVAKTGVTATARNVTNVLPARKDIRWTQLRNGECEHPSLELVDLLRGEDIRTQYEERREMAERFTAHDITNMLDRLAGQLDMDEMNTMVNILKAIETLMQEYGIAFPVDASTHRGLLITLQAKCQTCLEELKSQEDPLNDGKILKLKTTLRDLENSALALQKSTQQEANMDLTSL